MDLSNTGVTDSPLTSVDMLITKNQGLHGMTHGSLQLTDEDGAGDVGTATLKHYI